MPSFAQPLLLLGLSGTFPLLIIFVYCTAFQILLFVVLEFYYVYHHDFLSQFLAFFE